MASDLTIKSINVRQVPMFDSQGNARTVTRVTMYVGQHGPFTAEFGQGTGREDTPAAINAWKAEIIGNLMAIGAS